MPNRRRRHRTALQVPSDLVIVRKARSTPTRIGHEMTVEPEPPPAPELPPSRPVPDRSAPWTEELYVSPSGRIFLPAGFDFDTDRPRTVTRKLIRREPPSPRPSPRRARVVIGQRSGRARVPTRESWVVPPHLAPG